MRLPASFHVLPLAMIGALSAAACDSPISPSPPMSSRTPSPAADVQRSTVSGTVWVHAVDGVKRYAGARLFAWIESGGQGRSMGPVLTGGNGEYVLPAQSGSRVRIQVADAYQPCAVTVVVTGDVTRDVRVVTDASQLGARLPRELMEQTPVLSGTVFEVRGTVRRVPVHGVRVELDGLFGLGLVTATTLSDADGRYVLCGLAGDTSTYVYASKPGYRLFEADTLLNGNTTLDIELQR